jgi:hypothetical protein
MLKIGDVFEIPLSNAKFAYGQYVYKDSKFGPLIQVFDLITSDFKLEQLISSNPLFPPIITGVHAAVKSGLWRVVGHLTIARFNYPGFIYAKYDQKSGQALHWSYWDGKKITRLGTSLLDEYKKLEYLVVWSPFDVIHRIETGEYLFPYRDLILNNKFLPRVR